MLLELCVSLGPLVSKHKDEVRFIRDLLREMPVKDKSGSSKVFIP